MSRRLGLCLLALGLLLSAALSLLAIWGDMEAARFDRNLSLLREASLPGLRCPILLAAGESATVSAPFANPLDRPLDLRIWVHVSRYLTLLRETKTTLSLAPGEKQRLAWDVGPDDVVYDHLILVKMHQFRRAPLPGRTGSCGIVVLPLSGLSGRLAFTLALVAALLSLAAGLGLWLAALRPLRRRHRAAAYALGVLLAFVALAFLLALLGLWLAALFALATSLLLLGAILGHFAPRP